MGATTKKIDTTPTDITGLRKNMAGWLQNPNTQAPMQGPAGQQGMSAGQFNQQIQPFGGQQQNAAGVPSGGMNPGGYRPNFMPMGGGSRSDGFTPGMIDQGPGGGGSYGTPPVGQGGFNNIFNQMPQGGPAQVSWVGATPNAPMINPQQITQQQMMFAQGLNQNGIPQVQAGQVDPNAIQQMSQGAYMGVQNPMQGQFNRGQIRDINANNYSPYNAQTQSVDQLGGSNSQFFQNMQNQLSPAFQQQRAEALAQAKEGLGNMGNGTALANSLGVAMNRSLGEQQARLADYATQGMGMENNRQLQLAGLNSGNYNSANGQGLQANMANQGADSQFLNSLLGQNAQAINVLQGNQNAFGQAYGQGANNALQGMLANQSTGLNASGQNANNWLQGAGLNNQAQIANSGLWGNMLQSNQQANLNAQGQNAQNFLNNNQFNAQQAQGVNNANAGFANQYQQLASQIGGQNAANYLQMLLGMGTTGVGPAQVVSQPGWGSALGSLAGMGIGAFTGGMGSALGGALGKKIG